MTKAAIATAVGAPLEIIDIDVADPKAGEVRIELGASGVCHSDLSVMNGVAAARPPRGPRPRGRRDRSPRSARASTT